MCTLTPNSNAVGAKGIRTVPYGIQVLFPRKDNEDEDLPDLLYTLVAYILGWPKNLLNFSLQNKRYFFSFSPITLLTWVF